MKNDPREMGLEPPLFTRRQAVAGPLAALAGMACGRPTADSTPPYNAMGERVGEVGADSAIVHCRLTASPTRNKTGYAFPVWTHSLNQEQMQAANIPEGLTVGDLDGACPGKAGRVRLHYGTDPSLAGAQATEWVEVRSDSDFTHPFVLGSLEPNTIYHYAVEMSAAAGEEIRRGTTGSFRTAPAAEAWGGPIKFFVITGQDYGCRDRIDGYHSYEAMMRIGGDFLVSTGDNVYYDLDLPFARSVDLARYHWHRIYSQPLVVELFRKMSGYWLKDDHDSFEDDSWATRVTDRVQPMTYQDLAPVFVEQMPMGERTYRQVRWGKALEIWFVEGRDFRSPNSDPDGPEKTIWGAEQKEWLKRTLLESDAQFRVLISPTPVVGPDKANSPIFKLPGGGGDSHGVGGFAHERDEFLGWVRDNKLDNFLVICGDRHWQYHSADPKTSVHEFSCGTVSDRHAVRVDDDAMYRFVRSEGGFLSVSVEGNEQQPSLALRFHDIRGEVVYESIRRSG